MFGDELPLLVLLYMSGDELLLCARILSMFVSFYDCFADDLGSAWISGPDMRGQLQTIRMFADTPVWT